jgi:ketosteroid isomerase-like protein
MDDAYAINVAKTEFREAYNTGDVNRLLAILDDDAIDYSDGRQSGYGEAGRKMLRSHLQDHFMRYEVNMAPIIIEIRVMGDTAVDYGWHLLTLTPKNGGSPTTRKMRYIDIWKKDKSGNWKLAMYMDNADIPDQVSASPASA